MVLIVLAAVALPFAAPSASAEPEDRLADARAQLAALETQLQADREHMAALEEHLAQVNGLVDQNEDVYKDLDRRLAATRSTLQKTQAEHDEVQARFEAMLRTAYMDGNSDVLSAVVNTDGEESLEDRMDVMMMVADGNLQLAQQMSASAEALRTQNEQTSVLFEQQQEVVADMRAAQAQTVEQSQQMQEAITRVEATQTEMLELASRLKDKLGMSDLQALQESLKGKDSVTYGQWAKLLAGELGAPACKENLIVLISWQRAEGTDARWNPLATTYSMPGATYFNSVGVKNYVSLAQGLDASRLTLIRGWDSYGYGEIVQSLRRCGKAEDTAAHIAASSWCGCGSSYVVYLIDSTRKNFNFYSKI